MRARGAGVHLSRGQMLRALPLHVGAALLLGALTGAILYFLNQLNFNPPWHFAVMLAMAALAANVAAFPVALPGRHFTLAFIGAMMMLFVTAGAAIASTLFRFPHSLTVSGEALDLVNLISMEALAIGVASGLFYGVLAGPPAALWLGGIFGGIAGYSVGVLSLQVVGRVPPQFGTLLYDGALNNAWQVALAFAVIHAAGCFGAALGAGENKR